MTQQLNLDLPPGFDDYLFLDIELSGLHAASYPIEIGWCGLDLAAGSFLIKPHAHWSEDNWSFTSEKIHGIPRRLTIADGIEVVEAAARLNAVCAGKNVVSDRPHFDQVWLSLLFGEAGVVQAFTLQDAGRAETLAARFSGLDISEVGALQERVRRSYPHTHRAATDARSAAAVFVSIAMPDAVDAILAAA